MTIRSKGSRKVKLKKLPDVNMYDVLSQKANLELQLQEDKKLLEQMADFDPIHDVEEVYQEEKKFNPQHPAWDEGTDWQSLDPDSFGGSDFDLDPASIDTSKFDRDVFTQAEAAIKGIDFEQLRAQKLWTASTDLLRKFTKGSDNFEQAEAWIQTYSGKRFTPIKPNPKAIVIQDIAHALSMQCRFSGHVKQFYSVAQHCVLVSYICDSKDALWGLLHDATEAYLVDVPRPLKKSGKFSAYLEFEKTMQDAICERFELPKEEPHSVHIADTVLLATEARDLMAPLRPDWTQPVKPLPFRIEPMSPREAKLAYLERFFELIGSPDSFNRYLEHEAHGSI